MSAKTPGKDPLTGLPGFDDFHRDLDLAIADAVREDSEVCLAVADLDRFKALNDALGHEAGDAIIRRSAEQIRNAVGSKGRVYRVGGEEFGILLRGVEREDALFFLEKVREVFDKDPVLRVGKTEVRPHVTFSAGIASAPTDGDRGKALLAKADDALYRAKATGRDKVCLSREEKMQTKTSHYTQGQLKRLAQLAKKEGVGEAVLLREALEDLFRKFNGMAPGDRRG